MSGKCILFVDMHVFTWGLLKTYQRLQCPCTSYYKKMQSLILMKIAKGSWLAKKSTHFSSHYSTTTLDLAFLRLCVLRSILLLDLSWEEGKIGSQMLFIMLNKLWAAYKQMIQPQKKTFVNCFHVVEIQTILVGYESHNFFWPCSHSVSSQQERFKAKAD